MVVRELLTRWTFASDHRKLKAWGRQMKQAQKIAVGVSAAVAGALAAMVLPAAEIEDNIARALTIAGQPVEAFEANRDKLAKLAMDLGDDLSMSAANVSDSYYAVLSTGAKMTEQSFETLAREGLKFAKVGFIDTAMAVEFMDGTLKAFNLDAEEASRVTDVMQQTTFLAATNISQLTEAMKTAAPVAAGLDISIEETSAVLAGFADKLVKGGEAGNAFKRILANIKKEKIGKELESIGVKAFKGGKFVGMINFLEQLKEKTADMTQEKRAKTLLKIAGQYGESSLTALLQTDMEKLKGFKKALENSTGAVDKGLEQLKRSGPETFKSMYEAGKNFLSVFGFIVMDVLKPVALELMEIAVGLRKMAQNHPMLAKIATVLLLIVGGISAITAALTFLLPVVMSIKMAMITTFLILAAKVLLAVAAITILYIAIEDLAAFFTGNESMIGDFFEALAWWGKYAARSLKTTWLEFKLWFTGMWKNLNKWAGEQVTGIVSPIRDFFQNILPYQKSAAAIERETAATAARDYKGSGYYRPGIAGTAGGVTTVTQKVDISVPVVVENGGGVNGEEIQTQVATTVDALIKKHVGATGANFKPVVEQ